MNYLTLREIVVQEGGIPPAKSSAAAISAFQGFPHKNSDPFFSEWLKQSVGAAFTAVPITSGSYVTLNIDSTSSLYELNMLSTQRMPQ